MTSITNNIQHKNLVLKIRGFGSKKTKRFGCVFPRVVLIICSCCFKRRRFKAVDVTIPRRSMLGGRWKDVSSVNGREKSHKLLGIAREDTTAVFAPNRIWAVTTIVVAYVLLLFAEHGYGYDLMGVSGPPPLQPRRGHAYVITAVPRDVVSTATAVVTYGPERSTATAATAAHRPVPRVHILPFSRPFGNNASWVMRSHTQKAVQDNIISNGLRFISAIIWKCVFRETRYTSVKEKRRT